MIVNPKFNQEVFDHIAFLGDLLMKEQVQYFSNLKNMDDLQSYGERNPDDSLKLDELFRKSQICYNRIDMYCEMIQKAKALLSQ